MIREGRQRLRLLPGQHAAQLALPSAQRHRQKRILLGCQPRPGKADQRATLPHPGFKRFAFLRVRQFAIGQDQHGKTPRQQRFRRAATQLSKGIKCAQQVEKRADQGRIRPGILGCAETHRAAAEAFIQQENARRAGFRFQFQPHHLVADFAWQLQRCLCATGARRQGKFHPRKACAIPATRQDRDLPGQRHRRLQ